MKKPEPRGGNNSLVNMVILGRSIGVIGLHILVVGLHAISIASFIMFNILLAWRPAAAKLPHGKWARPTADRQGQHGNWARRTAGIQSQESSQNDSGYRADRFKTSAQQFQLSRDLLAQLHRRGAIIVR